MSSAKKAGIVQFAGEGYDTWKFRVETQLSAHGVKEAITQDPPEEEEAKPAFQEKDEKAKALLVAYIADSHLEYIREKETAKAMWTSLANTFAKKGFAAQTYIRRSMAMLRMEEGTSLADHFRRFDELGRQLKDAGATLTDLDMVSQLFISLPPSYDVVTTAMENLDDQQIKLETVKARLLAEEQKRSGRESSSSAANRSDGMVLAAKSGNRREKPAKFPGKCYHCGEIGHKKFACPKVKNRSDRAQIAKIPFDKEVALVSGAEMPHDQHEIEWVLDSGASSHMVRDEGYFQEIHELEEPLHIDSAKDGEVLVATKEGTVKGKLCVEGNRYTLSFGHVLFVRKLKYNLLSLARLLKVGVHVEFKPDRAILTKDGETIGVAKLKGNLFYLRMNRLPNGSALAADSNAELQLWHKRYGHLSFKNVLKLKNSSMVDGLDNVHGDAKFCEACAEANMVRQPFNSTRPQTRRPLERVHTDVCGQITPATSDGTRYFLSFVDDYTHFGVVYLLKKKDQVFEYFKVYEAMATAKFGTKIANLRCDLGREYFSKEQLAYYEEKGIQVESTVGYTPQQNGVAERFNRTIVEKMRAMLTESGAPKYLWGEAVLNAVYVTNRSPTEAIKGNQTPAERWHGEKPDVTKLRVFGCQAFFWVPKQKRSKLDPTGRKCVMLGYAPTGYRLWDQESRKMFVARDVRCNEAAFPFKSPSESVDHRVVIPEDISPVHEQEGENEEQELVEQNEDDQDDARDSDGYSTAGEEENDEEGAPALPPQSGRNELIGDVPRSSGRECRRPGWFSDFIGYRALSAGMNSLQIPECYTDVDGHPNEPEWRQAIQDELMALQKNQTWTVVKRPTEVKPVPCKWVFNVKTDADGRPMRYKARLVAKGYAQKKHVDYEETFAPVARLTTIRTLLALATTNGMKIHQLDVKTAFLNGKLNEKVYMQCPEGVALRSGEVCLLHRSLYGLKQSPRCWNSHFNEFLTTLGFTRSKHDYCLYVRACGDDTVYIVVYVDDLLIAAGNETDIERVKIKLMQEFEMTDMKQLHHFLGIKIDRDLDRGLTKLSQTGQIEKVIARFGMENCNPAKTPAEPKLQLKQEAGGCAYPYRELIGSLMYIMMGSRPDLCFIVGYLARFQDAAGEEHWKHAKRVLRYLQATKKIGLVYRKNPKEPTVAAYVDADFASDETDRKCVSGFLLKVHGNTVAWSSKKQSTVAMSSTEAEYVAMSSCVSETIWMTGLMADLQHDALLFPVPLYEDNQGAIAMAEREETRRVKHIDVKFHFIRNAVADGKIKLIYIPTQKQQADILTKSLAAPTFVALRSKLGLDGNN